MNNKLNRRRFLGYALSSGAVLAGWAHGEPISGRLSPNEVAHVQGILESDLLTSDILSPTVAGDLDAGQYSVLREFFRTIATMWAPDAPLMEDSDIDRMISVKCSEVRAQKGDHYYAPSYLTEYRVAVEAHRSISDVLSKGSTIEQMFFYDKRSISVDFNRTVIGHIHRYVISEFVEIYSRFVGFRQFHMENYSGYIPPFTIAQSISNNKPIYRVFGDSDGAGTMDR